jgi:hypothetical protein
VVSVHGLLTPLLWACSEAEHHVRKGVIELTSWKPGSRQRGTEKGARNNIWPQGHAPGDLLPPPSQKFPSPSNYAIKLWIHQVDESIG